jgi:hypothetical protein
MAEILQLAHLVQHHGMAQVQVGRGRVQAQLDAQRLAALFGARELLREFAFDQQFVDAASGDRQRLLDFVGQGQGGGCGLRFHKFTGR